MRFIPLDTRYEIGFEGIPLTLTDPGDLTVQYLQGGTALTPDVENALYGRAADNNARAVMGIAMAWAGNQLHRLPTEFKRINPAGHSFHCFQPAPLEQVGGSGRRYGW